MSLPECHAGVRITGQPDAIRAVVDALLSAGLTVYYDDRFTAAVDGDRRVYGHVHRDGSCVCAGQPLNPQAPSTLVSLTPGLEVNPGASHDGAAAPGPNFP